jgi:hypothetical protein
MDTIQSISVSEALEQLIYPSFFDSSERRAAYDFVMLWGTGEDKESAEYAKRKYPFDTSGKANSSETRDEFPIVSTALFA